MKERRRTRFYDNDEVVSEEGDDDEDESDDHEEETYDLWDARIIRAQHFCPADKEELEKRLLDKQKARRSKLEYVTFVKAAIENDIPEQDKQEQLEMLWPKYSDIEFLNSHYLHPHHTVAYNDDPDQHLFLMTLLKDIDDYIKELGLAEMDTEDTTDSMKKEKNTENTGGVE
ncbi:hypothetical protein DV736_g6712, partial [Chaetothyriales sp. CBS 134916]